MIDEYPILAIAASQAKGTTFMEGVEELRYKETDRIKAIVESLCILGVKANDTKDSISITGIGENSTIQGGVELDSRLDHRIAMSFLCLGLITKKPIILNNTETINSSFPSFLDQMNLIGANLRFSTTLISSAND
jgi:3-phosphoshikimate 1-carboxyvinyltransferase